MYSAHCIHSMTSFRLIELSTDFDDEIIYNKRARTKNQRGLKFFEFDGQIPLVIDLVSLKMTHFSCLEKKMNLCNYTD